MSIYSAFYASLSGLSSNANALGVIGNNLANLNTVGFKSSTASFQDLFNAAIANQGTQGNGDPMQVGLGASLGSVAEDFSQGSFQQTGSVTDMALQGNGFFTVANKAGSALYTRDGNFTIDKSGYLVDSSGDHVQGWNATNGTISTNGLPGAIQVNLAGTSGGAPTANMEVIANLDSTSAAAFTSTVQIYDSLGATHSVNITFPPAAATVGPPPMSNWSIAAAVTDGGTVTAGLPASVSFDQSGNFAGWTDSAAAFHSVSTPATYTNPSLTISGWSNGAAPNATTWLLTSPAGTGAALTKYLSSYASTSTTSATSQDGFGAGTVSSLTVDQNGTIIGNFTNGQTIPMAQVAISTFLNEGGLSKQGGNNWIATVSSGSAAVGAANTGGRGSILGSNLELSNVDVATELTAMIINQNGYQANSRVVTTANNLLQEVLNLIH